MDTYFTEYENLEVHELMLKDRPRQEAYCNAILKNKDLFKDKVVLDVGAGTGILSAFCAKAGARLVYAVEASNLATKVALDLFDENNLTGIVKVIHSKIEEFALPANAEKVDIIVSEWMGFYLLHEGMLDSVLFARDHFLKPDGLIFPSECTIYVAPCSVPALFDYWQNIDGVSMERFASKLRLQKSTRPEITYLKPADLLHEGIVFHWMSLLDVDAKELDEISFKEVVSTQVAGKHQGFCIWFDVRFPCEEEPVTLSTSPLAPKTHWKQCVVVLPKENCEVLEENSPVAFQILMKRSASGARKYNLEVELLDPNVEEHPVPCSCHMTKCILTKAHLISMDTS
ncbi:probable protein arginine N-methyltransferase 6.1 [Drosophila grimshawi]|uniref:type I protein arginine methyltransferase n=1 Tax=Drosophila grimshawi TaxID=7222 RepID=B4JQ09_DROGR|nr:probable protein arginine N-methyltransferase 6.1 [Drosophila grimshawi]EDV98989.1 GH13621 [Drosophila grimshawi]